MSRFHSLTISELRATTDQATVLAFKVPDELESTFNFRPGQFLTLRFQIDNQEVRRAYSICSSAREPGRISIGVKRVEGGLVSNYIPDHLQIGNQVDVMPPEGMFQADVKPDNYRTYYLFASGSGITPILSILTTVLAVEKDSYVYLLYGNRDQNSIMFLPEISALLDRYPDRFFVEHCLSRPRSGLSGLFRQQASLAFNKGRIDRSAIRQFIDGYQPYAQDALYYICGPAPMIESTEQALRTMDVPDERIFVERFSSGATPSEVQGVAAELTATLEGRRIRLEVAQGQTVLRALLAAGHDAPYSCEGGVCSTCQCELQSGEVHMKTRIGLSDAQIEAGTILSCQSIPLTPELEVRFTD